MAAFEAEKAGRPFSRLPQPDEPESEWSPAMREAMRNADRRG
jgi:hypothetical protein